MKHKVLKRILVSLCAICFLLGMTVIVNNGGVKADGDDTAALEEVFDMFNSSIVDTSAQIPGTVHTDYTTGIKFKLNSSGSYIDYGRIIDLNKVEGNLIEIVPNVDVQSFGLKSIRVRLTDAYDSSNSITVSWEVNRDGPRLLSEGNSSQVKGNATLCCSFIKVGFMDAEGGYANYAPEQGTVVGWAQNFLPAFDYLIEEKKPQPFIPLAFSYNVATNGVYSCLQENDAVPGDRNYLMLDLDNEDDDYPDFAGFSTGEVYVTIESMGSAGEFVVTKIGNDKMSDLVDGNLGGGGLMFGGYDFENMVNGVVGYPYPIPVSRNKYPVTAKLEKLVGEDWTDVTSELTENGTKFTPSAVGNYRLSYTGKTNSGTDSSVSGEFEVIASPVEITEKESVSLSAEITKTFTVPSLAFEGGIGKLSVEYTLSVNGTETPSSVGSALAVNEKGMEITLKVKVTDAVRYSKEFEYPVTINENVKQFELVGYHIVTANAGDKLSVPDFIANDWSKSGGDVSCKSEVKITSDFADGNLSVGDEITVNANGAINYTWGENTISYIVVCSPKNVSTDTIAEFFHTDGISKIETTSIGTEFTVDKEDVTVNMPNPVSVTDLVIEYSLYNSSGLESKSGYNVPFTAVNVILQSLNGKKVILTIDKANARRPVMNVNGLKGGTISTCTDNLADSSDLTTKYRKFSFSFDGATAAIYDGNGNKVCDIKTWNDGLPFDGFEECKAYVSFELVGGQAGNKLILNTLSNQKFAQMNLGFGDMCAPALALNGGLKSEFVEPGTELTIPIAYAYDVFCRRSSIKMTVRTPDGDILSGANPQEYKLNFSKAGKYVISYAVSDRNRNSTVYEFVYRVLDKQAPEIKLDGSYAKSYSGKVKVLAATVSDNNDNSDNNAVSYVMLEKSDLTYSVVAADDTLELSKGKYAIVYYAFDSDGNFTIARYEFEVK